MGDEDETDPGIEIGTLVDDTGTIVDDTGTLVDDTDPKSENFNFTTVNGPWPKKFKQIKLTELGKGFAKVTKLNDKGETARFSETDRTEQLIIYTAHNGTGTQPVFYIARCPSDQCEEGKNMKSNILETKRFTRDASFPNSRVYRFMSGSDNYRIKPLHSNSTLSTLLHRFDDPNFDTTNITEELIEASNDLYTTTEHNMSRQNYTPPSPPPNNSSNQIQTNSYPQPTPSKPPKSLSRPMVLTPRQNAILQAHANAGNHSAVAQLYKKFMDQNAGLT
jgi:hypothetical protein